MSASPSRSPAPPPRQSAAARIQFLDYRSEPAHREYRLALHTPEGSAEVRLRIALAAFAANRVLLQDGPDVCYQLLQHRLDAGEAPGAEVVAIGDAELTAYREAHTPVPRRSVTPRPAPKRTPFQRAPGGHPKLPVAPLPVAETEAVFGEGQRVSHAVYGVGVTLGSSGGHTSVRFDQHGVRTFVTSLLKLDALSAAHEWETGPRGKNRPRDTAPPER